MNLFLVLSLSGALVALVPFAPDPAACARAAAAETAAFAARGDAQFTVRCAAETDPAIVMAMKLHPELRGAP